jgi:predicted phage tail protein
MNLKVLGGLVVVVVWAVAALVLQGPGWVHLLLTIGVSLIIYGIVSGSSAVDERSTNAPPDASRR